MKMFAEEVSEAAHGVAELEFPVCITTRFWNTAFTTRIGLYFLHTDLGFQKFYPGTFAVAYLDVGIQAGTHANAGE
jgi:hypothetical protein